MTQYSDFLIQQSSYPNRVPISIEYLMVVGYQDPGQLVQGYHFAVCLDYNRLVQ